MKEANKCPKCEWPLNFEDSEKSECPKCHYSWK